jgi:hypothetical protein
MTKEDGTAKKTEHTLLSSNTFIARNYAVQNFIKQQKVCLFFSEEDVTWDQEYFNLYMGGVGAVFGLQQDICADVNEVNLFVPKGDFM